MKHDLSLAVSSEFKDGALLVAPSLLADDGSQSGRGFESMQPLGILARPKDPDTDPVTAEPTNGAGLITAYSGSEGFAAPTTDPRALAKMAPIKKGGFACGSALCGAPGGQIVFDGDNGALQILVPNVDASKNHMVSIDSATDCIQIISSKGLRVILDDGAGSVFIQAGAGATIELKTDGTGTLNGNFTVNGSMQFGSASSKVALLSDVNAVKAQIAALTTGASPGASLGSNVPATTPGSSSLNA